MALSALQCSSRSLSIKPPSLSRTTVQIPFVAHQVTRPFITRQHPESKAAHQAGLRHGAPSRCTALQPGKTFTGSVIGSPDTKFAIVVARFNDLVTKLLLEGALEAFQRHGVSLSDVDVVWVPGSFELPVVAKGMAKSGVYGAVVCIGTVVRGATTHYDAVVSGATSGVLGAAIDTGVPVVFGVLTCDDMDQALDRAGGKVGNKGGEAAITAIEMANLLSVLKQEGKFT